MINKYKSHFKGLILKFSIKTKITIIIISVSLLAIVIGFSVITLVNINNLKKDLVNQSYLIAKLMGEYSLYGLVIEDTRSVVDNLKNLDAIGYVIGAEIYDQKGDFFASYQNKPASRKSLIINSQSFKFQPDELHIYVPIFSSDAEREGAIFLRISLITLNENVKNYLVMMFIIIICVTLITILFANSFQKIISRPILKLAEITTRISETNDYTIRIPKKTNDEIGVLYDGFNNMLEEIVRNQEAMLKVQNELKDSEEQFSAFMIRLPAAAFIKEQDSSFRYVNKFLIDNFSAQNWIGRNISHELPSQKRHFSSEFDKDALYDIQNQEEFLYDNKNDLRYFETWKFPIQRKEKETLIGGIAIDTTKRKLIENQVNYYINELERNNHELEEFNYVASHDLREPLRTITSYCDLLIEDIGPEMNQMVKEDIKFITDATTRMNILIQDLLQLSRAGRVEFERQNIDLNELVSTVLKDLELIIKESNTTIKFSNLPEIMGDATQIGRVFQNLLTNAIKFRSANDPIIIISSIEKTNYYEISVEDNGIGIDKQYYQQIFSAFKRLHSREEYDGTGIGLAICKKIIERHNGTIWIDSELGKGSRFFINFKKE